MVIFLLGGFVFLSYFGPKREKEEPAERAKIFEEKIKEIDLGKSVLKILGAEKEEKKESIVENVKGKIEKAIIEETSQKVIDIIKNLPPEEFEKLKKELCPQFCGKISLP